MTTINDRITNLEDQFGDILGFLRSIDAKLSGVDGKVDRVEGKVDGLVTDMAAVVYTLNQHSIELQLIKEHLG